MGDNGGIVPGERFGRRYRSWLLTLLFLLNTLNFADRAILSSLAEAVKRDLAISDFQLGLLQGFGFAFLYATLGLPIARAAERRSRVRIVAVAVGLWSLFATLCGATANFAQLMLCRVGIGIGEAGFNAPVSSLIADHYPSAKRASVMALIGLGGAAGPMIGAIGGGWMGDHYGWRTAFVVIGLPGLILAPITWLTLTDPPRGHADGLTDAEASAPPLGVTLRALFAKRAFRQVLIGGTLAALGSNAIGQFLGVYLVRAFALNFTQAGALFGVVSAFAVTSGLLAGGFGADLLGRRDPRWLPWGSAIGLALSTPMFALGFLQATPLAATLCFAAASVLVFLYYGPALAMVQDLAPPRMRATAAFLSAFVIGIVGLGVGPALIGLISDHAAAAAYGGNFAADCRAVVTAAPCKAAAVTGIRTAMLVNAGFFLWAAFHYFLAARHYREDRFAPTGAAPRISGAAA